MKQVRANLRKYTAKGPDPLRSKRALCHRVLDAAEKSLFCIPLIDKSSILQIGRRNGLLPLVKMFQRAKSDDERISAANALWMLLFDAENRELLKQIDAAFESLQAHEVGAIPYFLE